MPSEFKKFQSSECKERNLLDRTKLCPTCLPDPTAPEINWISQPNPYFDARTCEYVSVYRIPKRELLTQEFATLAEIGEKFKKEAIRILLRHYGKLENDYTVCAFGGCLTSEEFDEYSEIFNDFYNTMVDNYQNIVDKYSLANSITAGVGGGILGGLALGASITIGGLATAGIASLIGFLTYSLADSEINSEFEELAESLDIEAFREDLINLVGPDKLEGLKRLADIYSEIHPYALEWVATIPEDGFIVDDSNHVKFKLTVPAYNFDLIPMSPTENPDAPSETENNTTFPDEIILKSENLKDQKSDLLATLKVFQLPHEFFKRIEGGRLLYRERTSYSEFSYRSAFNKTKEFFGDLEGLVFDNNFRFHYQFTFDINKRILQELKIQFDNSDPKEPLKIKKILGKGLHCDFEELVINTNKIKKYKPTVMNFLINIKEITDLQKSQEKLEWLDFSLNYVYPPLKVDYGRNTGAELDDTDLIECLGNPGDWAGENIIDPIASFFSTYAFNLEHKVCTGEAPIEDVDPLSIFGAADRDRIAKQLAEKRRAVIEREQEQKRDNEVKRLQKEGVLLTEQATKGEKDEPDPASVATTIDGVTYYTNPEKEASIDDMNPDLLTEDGPGINENPDPLAVLSDINVQTRTDEEVAAAKEKIREDLDNKFSSYYFQQALDSVTIDETFQTFLNAITGNGENTDNNTGNWWYDAMAFIGLCGIRSISTGAIACLSKGIQLADLQETIIKNTLKNITPQNLEDILILLPPSAREQIAQQMLEDFGESFQPPWATQETNQVIKSPEERKNKIVQSAIALKKKYNKRIEEMKQGNQEPGLLTATSTNWPAFEDKAKLYVEKPNEDFTEADLKRFSLLIDEYTPNKGDKTGGIDLSKSMSLIIDAYVDNILRFVDNNTVLEALRRSPFSEPIVGLLNVLVPDCEGRDQKELGQLLAGLEPSGGFLEAFTIDVCNPLTSVIKFRPPVFKGSVEILDFVFPILQSTIDKMIGQFLKRIITDVLRVADSALCKSLEALGRLGTNAITGDKTPLEEVFKDAFCPDLTDEQVKDELNKLLENMSPTDRTGPGGSLENLDLAACLGNALAGSVTKQQLLALIIDPTSNDSVLQNIVDAIEVNCPELSGIYGSPSLVQELLENMANAVPPETILALSNTIDPTQDEILSETICFTSEELEQYYSSLQEIYDQLGIPAEEAAQLGYQNTLNNLNDLLDQTNTMDQMLEDALNSSPHDAIQDYLDTLPPGDYSKEELRNKLEECSDFQTTSALGGNLYTQPRESVQLENLMTNSMFSQIHGSFIRELIDDDKGILSIILSDKQGICFSRHSFLNSNFLLGTFYHNTEQSAADSDSILDIFNPFTMIPNRGYFPDTVGLYFKNQLIELDSEYKETPQEEETVTNVITDAFAITEPNFIIQYEWNSRPFDKRNKISCYLEDFLANLDYKINYKSIVDTYKTGEIKINRNLSESESALIEPFISDAVYIPYRKRVFESIVKKSFNPLGEIFLENSETYKFLNTKILNYTKNLIVNNIDGEVQNGFNFGWVDDPITKEDLTYVAPDGSPYEFEEEERVLGRSATNNPRVHFLNPDIYGGTFLKPPVFVDPVDFNGWMDLARVLIPEISSCQEKRDNVFRLKEISDYCNKIKNSSDFDPRVGSKTLTCFEEKPFDKIATGPAKAGLAGVTKSIIRTHVVENLIKSIPIFSNLKYNNKNYDELYEKFLSRGLESRLTNISTFDSKIQRENFYLLFLEQAVVDYQRKIDEGSVSPSQEVNDALERISAAERNYTSIYSTLSKMGSSRSSVELDPITIDYVDNFDFENYDREEFIVYALYYQNKKEQIFESTDPVKLGFWQRFITADNLLADCRIWMIRIVKEQCEIILSALIREEFENTLEFVFSGLEPTISDLKLYSLTETEIFSNTELKNIGTSNYDNKIANFETVELGNVKDVVDDIEEFSPFSNTPNPELIIEKYIRVKDKDGVEIEQIVNRDFKLRDVVSTEGFSVFMEQLKQEHPDKYLSEIFGDAELIYQISALELLNAGATLLQLQANNVELSFPQQIYFNRSGNLPGPDAIGNSIVIINQTIAEDLELDLQPIGYKGEIGINTGVRICLKPGQDSVDGNFAPNEEQLNLSRREKSYYCNHRAALSPDTFGAPICSVEIEMVDHKVSDFNLEQGPNRFDLDCLLRKLVETEEFKLFFEKIFNFRMMSSILAIHSNLFFIESIGIEDEWDNTDGLTGLIGAFADWPTRPDTFFEKTYSTCRKMFASFYYSSNPVNQEVYKDSIQSEQLLSNAAKDFFKNLYNEAAIDNKLKKDNPFERSHRRYTSKPFDENGEECEDIYKKIFS